MTNAEFNEKFRIRTRAFAVRTILLLDSLPKERTASVITFQLAKAATSIGANFRAFCRGRSKNEKYAKICIVVEEADETEYWLLVLHDLGWGNQLERKFLIGEIEEIIKVTSKIKSGLRP